VVLVRAGTRDALGSGQAAGRPTFALVRQY
jgi:hypothetical protein